MFVLGIYKCYCTLVLQMWLWTLIGLCIITKVHGFANGAPNDEETCKKMSPKHRISAETDALPQTTKSPFEVTYELGQRKEPITGIDSPDWSFTKCNIITTLSSSSDFLP